jgi:hypothetical protein
VADQAIADPPCKSGRIVASIADKNSAGHENILPRGVHDIAGGA